MISVLGISELILGLTQCAMAISTVVFLPH